MCTNKLFWCSYYQMSKILMSVEITDPACNKICVWSYLFLSEVVLLLFGFCLYPLTLRWLVGFKIIALIKINGLAFKLVIHSILEAFVLLLVIIKVRDKLFDPNVL